jgi:6-phosphogluconolactonase
MAGKERMPAKEQSTLEKEGITQGRADEMNRKIITTLITAAMLMGSAVAAMANGNYRQAVGAVYTMTNADDENQVVVFERDRSGLLTLVGAVPTEGLGSGGDLDPLGSQGAIVLTGDKQWLLAVNAGSNEISVFRATRDGLTLTDKVDSGGEFPVSVTVCRNLVYVLNAKGAPNIAGFYLNRRGQLTPRSSAVRNLGAGGYAQVGFDPRGEHLVVTDRDGNEILVFPLDRRGLPAMVPVASTSNGLAPFGFTFDEKGILLVSEAGSGAVSSYAITPDGSLRVISPSVENGQNATCWIARNADDYVFTANTGSQSLSVYTLINGKARWSPFWPPGPQISDGSLELLDATAASGNRPIDIGVSVNGRFLYALDPAAEAVDMFEIEADGTLTSLGTVPGGLSIFAQGIAVY